MRPNWIVTLTRNNLHLTQTAIRSFRAQDAGDIHILVIDNESTDNTVNWLHTQKDIFTIMNQPQKGVAGGWNQALKWLFSPRWADGNTPLPSRADYALVCNNDVELRPDTYRYLLADGGGFVTAVGTTDKGKIRSLNPPRPEFKRPHPDFSCYLIRREVWEKVGPFDENFKIAFSEDQDYHVRMHRAGIRAECLDLPFYHYASATIKHAPYREIVAIHRQAEANRKYFEEKWGFPPGSEAYYDAFGTSSPPEETTIAAQSGL